MLAAAEKNLPIVVPGWEDSTLGNMYAAPCIRGDVKNVHTVRTGIEYMTWLAECYTETVTKNSRWASSRSAAASPGDFPICVVPMLHQDLERDRRAALGLLLPDQRLRPPATAPTPAPCPTRRSPGASCGADTPKFIIECDATIVAPLVFAYVLGW